MSLGNLLALPLKLDSVLSQKNDRGREKGRDEREARKRCVLMLDKKRTPFVGLLTTRCSVNTLTWQFRTPDLPSKLTHARVYAHTHQTHRTTQSSGLENLSTGVSVGCLVMTGLMVLYLCIPLRPPTLRPHPADLVSQGLTLHTGTQGPCRWRVRRPVLWLG